MNFKVGVISHYYDKIGVAVIDLLAPLATGDKVKFVRGGEDLFEQVISSIQVEHKKVDSADKGESVGIKVDEPIKDGAEVYKV